MKRLPPFAFVALIVLLATPATAGETRLEVYAAASLSAVFPKLDATARHSFAGSDQLAFQIRQGARADVYAAAAPKQPQALYADGLVYKPRTFATNELIVAVPRSNPGRIATVFSLRRRGLKVVVGQRGVPIGDYTRRVLAKLGIANDVLRNVVSEEADVRGILAKVALGEADAGFVYVTDVRAARKRLRGIPIPRRAQPAVRYEIAVVRSTRTPRAARAYVRRVLGPAGRRRLAAAGFGLPRLRGSR